MNFNGSDVQSLLQAKGATGLYHANTVRTASTQLAAGGLISRAFAEANKLDQTPQASDDKDKQYGVWGDIFVDPVDIHGRAAKRNSYGPVLFVLRLELLAWPELGVVRIAKRNPLYWTDGESEASRYFTTLAEAEAGYTLGDFNAMFTIRDGLQPIPFTEFLRHIELDNPAQITEDQQEVAVQARHLLGEAVDNLGLAGKVHVVGHRCRSTCRCGAEYAALDDAEIGRLFT